MFKPIREKYSKLTLIKPKFPYIYVTNADCSYNWKKTPKQNPSTFSGAQALWFAEPESHFLMICLHFFFPANRLKDVTPLDKLCHIPVPSRWQQRCYNVEGIILHRVFLMFLLLIKMGPLPCLGGREEGEDFIIIVIKLTLGNSWCF